MNADGTATVGTLHGRQENGSGAVMGLVGLVADELGLPTEDISILYQDTDAGGYDRGSSAADIPPITVGGGCCSTGREEAAARRGRRRVRDRPA